jgi:hypothetical protein
LKAVLFGLSGLAAVGLLLALAVHVAAIAGMALFGEGAFVLHGGIFVVWLPTVIVSHRATREFKRNHFWKAALRGCPPWMRGLTYALFAYAMVNFGYFFLTTAVAGRGHAPLADAATRRLFSGHWMAFYAAAMSALYSSARIPSLDATRRCTQGHPVGPSASFCEECGAPVLGTSLRA